ncbi:MAG: dienelactone hydrolase family protein [Candidatus Levybacteria bacterium]|nr:dienelactone hydrolase family protein [Candidatus Levybacteria bacterium]
MRKLIFVISFIFLALVAGGYVFFIGNNKIISPLGSKLKEKPLDKYTFENLRKTEVGGTPIILGPALKSENDYVSQIFFYSVGGKKVSGLLNAPVKDGTYPVVVMFRGFVPKENYGTGVGTQRGGEVFAQNGFITLAPDFLGYGQSENPSENAMEERFQTYTAALALLSSLSNLNTGLEASYSGRIKADTEKIGLWGHSNGGHIALAVLEITGKNYPTVLWAPVSKPFPYSILYYTDEFDDHGKMLRKALWEFEKDYDAELYSPANYYSWIKAPIQLHQGTLDESIPIKWSDELVKTLEKLQKDIAYFVYPGADHNLLPNGWSLAVERSMAFYRDHLL